MHMVNVMRMKDGSSVTKW